MDRRRLHADPPAAVRGFMAARDEWEVVIPDAGPGAEGPADPEQGDRP